MNATRPPDSVMTMTTLFHNYPTQQNVPVIVSFVLIAGGMAVFAIVISRIVNCLVRRKSGNDDEDNRKTSISGALKATMPLQVWSVMYIMLFVVNTRQNLQ